MVSGSTTGAPASSTQPSPTAAAVLSAARIDDRHRLVPVGKVHLPEEW